MPLFFSLAWALILILSSKANPARLILGIFMINASMVFLSHVVYYHHLKNIYLHFDLIFIFSCLSVFPIFNWYMKILTFNSKIGWKDMKLLIPAFAVLLATSITFWLMDPEMRTRYIDIYLFGDGDWHGTATLIKAQLILDYTLKFVYFVQLIYSIFKFRAYIAKFNKNVQNFYSNLENLTLEWPRIILYSVVVTSSFSVVTNFLGRLFFDKWPLLLLFMGISYSIFLFVLGYSGFMQHHTVVFHEAESDTLPQTETTNTSNNRINTQLQVLFENKMIFKNKDLKISDIASQLNTNRTYISTFINNEYGCSFNTFVNKYWVEEAKKLITNDEYKNFSLDHIASLSGFGSLHTFIRVFKEITNTTPGRYRESL